MSYDFMNLKTRKSFFLSSRSNINTTLSQSDFQRQDKGQIFDGAIGKTNVNHQSKDQIRLILFSKLLKRKHISIARTNQSTYIAYHTPSTSQ